MATARYAHCEILDVRREVERRLGLPAPKVADGDAWDFWNRVNHAGLLLKALDLFDQIAEGWEYWRHVQRETRKEFWQRIDREGRRAEAERALNKLLTAGVSRRKAQEELVEQFQPVDGGETQAWRTPDPWANGRLFRSGADQAATLALANGEDEDDIRLRRARERVQWARLRRTESEALAAWREEARKLTAAAANATASAASTPPASTVAVQSAG
jgi:hypothetical protein